jgi:hypothetical protein
MTETTLAEKIATLFEPEARGYFTYAAGYSHAKFDQYTELARHIHEQMLKMLDHCGVEYFLFAGSMVGYVRNQSMPYWMDDLDIIIFDDQLKVFEEVALPLFAECGFNCFFQNHLKGGGYHLLSMQQGESRKLTIALNDTTKVSVPWAQIDAFYTTVDENGIIRNPVNWGIYHSKDIPLDWVKPGRVVDIDGLRVKVFSDFEADIRKEYGDVSNVIVVRNHSTVFLHVADVAWPIFEKAFKDHLAKTSTPLPGRLTPLDFARHQPKAGVRYATTAEDSLESMCEQIVKLGAETIHLSDGEQNFWAMDLNRLLPKVKITASVQTILQAQRAAHLRAFIETVDCASADVTAEYDRCITKLRIVLGQ